MPEVPAPDAEAVAGAVRDWVWVPPGATEVVTREYRLTHWPAWSAVHLLRPERPAAELVAEVTELARGAGRPVLRWWVADGDDPAVEKLLRAAGLPQVESVDVFALDLTGGARALERRLDVPPAVAVTPADDEEALRAADRIAQAAFGDPPASDALIAQELALTQEGLRTGRWAGRQFLASLEGRPVGMGGCGLVREAGQGPEGVLRLWGAGVLPGARGRGAYRALLARRCGFGTEQGMRMALVKGRVATSGPILRRAGFAAFGQERRYDARLVPGASDPSAASTPR